MYWLQRWAGECSFCTDFVVRSTSKYLHRNVVLWQAIISWRDFCNSLNMAVVLIFDFFRIKLCGIFTVIKLVPRSWKCIVYLSIFYLVWLPQFLKFDGEKLSCDFVCVKFMSYEKVKSTSILLILLLTTLLLDQT